MGSLGASVLALMGMGDRRFREAASSSFDFLVREYGFAAPQFDAHAAGATLLYRRPNVAVDVSWDKQENLIEVYVVRLQNGKLPLLVEEPQDWIYLTALVSLRAPRDVPALIEPPGRSLRNVEKILTAAATALREHGRNALGGDDAVFAEVFARYPQLRKRREWFQRT